MPDQELQTIEILSRKMTGLSSLCGIEVSNVREKKESKGLYSHLEGDMDWPQGMGKESESLARCEERSQV